MNDVAILAIEPEWYRTWMSQAREVKLTPKLVAEMQSPEAAARLRPSRRSQGDILVLRIGGFITQKVSLMTLLFGGTSTESLAQEIRAGMADSSIGSIVLDVNSPGGSVFGVTEAARAIRGLRGQKPMIAVSNAVMASAAYYLAAQADEIVASPSSLTGSIGTMAVHVDESEAIEKLGLKVEEFTYGEHKADESSVKPLTDGARDAIQARVDYYGQMFESDVAKARGVSVSTVRASFGQGRVFNAEDAVRVGMVDRVGTLDDVLGGLAGGRSTRVRVAAGADPVEIAARAALAGVDTGRLK